MEENYGHKPVLLHECLGALAIKPDGIYVDGTLGRAGHSLEIVRRLTTGRLIALDRDETAIEAANRRLGDYLDKVTLVHSNFSALDAVLHELGVHGVDGMLFDLGVSSPQLDEAQRGFSYKQDAPLDMRMDESAALTAREVVNTYSYEELRRILFEYGEERYAPAIAKRICQHREQKPIETTLELADIIRSAMPASALREKQHPAKRSFQAIRIAVNGELDALPPRSLHRVASARRNFRCACADESQRSSSSQESPSFRAKKNSQRIPVPAAPSCVSRKSADNSRKYAKERRSPWPAAESRT